MDTLETEIKRGESDVLELKREIPKKDIQFLKTVVAFANGRGGRIILGVDDTTHEVVGVTCETRAQLQDLVTDMISNACKPQIYPTYDWADVQGRAVLIVEIPEGMFCPYYIAREGELGGTYVRVGATTRKAGPEKVRELQMYGKNVCYDSTITKKATPVTDDEIRMLCRLFNEHKDAEKPDVTATQLVNWEFLTKSEEVYMPTVAFQLLVGRSSFRFSGIQCARFEGNTQVNYLDRKTFVGTLYDQYYQAITFLCTHLHRSTTIDDVLRRDQYEIPLPALREAVANAIIHRNYLLHGMIKVSVFDSKVEISSPGTLFGNLSKREMMSGISRLRNPLLADAFHRFRLVEQWGGGVRRIFDLCKENKCPSPHYTIGDDSVTITFKRVTTLRRGKEGPVRRRDSANGSGIRQEIVKMLKKTPRASRKQLAEALNTTPSNVQYHLCKLREEGIVERTGTMRGGEWIVRKSF